MSILLFGGSFNPIHFGHLISARSVAEQLGLDKIVLIPSAAPPHKSGQDLAPADDRLAMARLAVEGDPLFEVDDLELRRTGPSYTFDTVMEYRRRVGPLTRLCWLIGADTLPELATWSRVGKLVEAVEIVTATRPGWRQTDADLSALRAVVGQAAVAKLLSNCLTTPEIGISASEIRSRVRAGRSVRYLLPAGVEAYLRERRVY
jgi:nicotinate-nucleotide adenylyltransferase